MGCLLIRAGRVWTCSPRGVLEDHYVVVEEGRIAGVFREPPKGLQGEVVDASSLDLTPGLIDAHTHIGVHPLCSEYGEEGVETSDPLTPHLSVLDALDVFDEAFKDAVSGGVTTVCVMPGSMMSFGEIVEKVTIMPGQCAIVKCDGRVLVPNAGVKIALGEHPKRYLRSLKLAPTTRMGIVAAVRGLLERARKACEDADEKLKALKPLLEGKVPARIHVHTRRDIMAALRIADDFNLKVILDHGTEAPLIAGLLAERRVPVVYGPPVFSRRGTELRRLALGNVGVLVRAGVPCTITTDHPTLPIQYLSLIASATVGEAGLSPAEALELVTSRAAEVLGLSGRIGRVEEGLDADLVLYDGNPLDPDSRVVCTMIEGRVVYGGV